MSSETERSGKRKANEEQEPPYVPTGMEITTMCFVSNEDKMEQFNACVLKGHMKDRKGKKVHISELPKSFFDLQNDAQVQIVFRKVSLEGYFRLPPWGMDYQRSYELMTSIDANGNAILTDLTGSKVKVTIDKATIERALRLKPAGQIV